MVGLPIAARVSNMMSAMASTPQGWQKLRKLNHEVAMARGVPVLGLIWGAAEFAAKSPAVVEAFTENTDVITALTRLALPVAAIAGSLVVERSLAFLNDQAKPILIANKPR